MKIENGGISILVSGDKTSIEIIDNTSSTTFCVISLTPEQLSLALSRLSNTPCNIEVFGLEKIGKKHENTSFTFEIPEHLSSSAKSKELYELAKIRLAEQDMSEWNPDTYFSSQDTFSIKNGKHYANVVIRRWI